MELRQIFNQIVKWAWLIGLAIVIAATSSFIASKAATPLYRTTSTMMIGRVTESLDPNNTQIWTSQQLAYTYIQLAKREPVLKGAIESLGLNMDWQNLASRVNASSVPQTQLLEITVVDSDPYRAKVLADAIVQQLILLSPGTANRDAAQAEFTQTQLNDLQTKIKDGQQQLIGLKQELDAANSARQIQDLQTQMALLENKISTWQQTYSTLLVTYQGSDVNALSLLEEAPIPTRPFSPNVMNNVMVASVVGLILALGGIFLIEYLDDTVKSHTDVKRATGLAHLVSLPLIEGDGYAAKLVAAHEPLSPAVEAFRVLRTNLQFSSLEKPLASLMLTSPNPSEGKSVALANLAVVLAQSGKQVCIVDADLRRPTQHKIFNLPNRIGLTDALIHVISPFSEESRKLKKSGFHPGVTGEGSAAGPVAAPDNTSQTGECPDLSEYLQDTGVPNLYLLASGQLPPNPTELVGSELICTLIQKLNEKVDIVLFDSPPTLVFADSAVLSTRVDGVILITDTGRTRTAEASRAAEELRKVRANLLGVVLNRVDMRTRDNYYYYYYYQDNDRKHPNERMKLLEILERVFNRVSNKKLRISERISSSPNED